MFQDFAARELVASRHSALELAADDAAALVDRYPNLSEIELARLINLIKGRSALHVRPSGLGKKPRDYFWATHRSRNRTPLRHYAALLAVATVAIFLVVWVVAFVG